MNKEKASVQVYRSMGRYVSLKGTGTPCNF